MMGLGSIELKPSATGGTTVMWSDELQLGGSPLMRWLGFAMDSMRTRNLEQGLSDLKRNAEQ